MIGAIFGTFIVIGMLTLWVQISENNHRRKRDKQ
jgi:hypothetical protein